MAHTILRTARLDCFMAFLSPVAGSGYVLCGFLSHHPGILVWRFIRLKRMPMNWPNSKAWVWIFGFLAIGGLAVFLMLRHGSPGPLSASHAQAIKGTFVKSCKQCHTGQGLTQGCLNCHDEIARQIDQDRGYHAYLFQDESQTCQQCHPEHRGESFPLVSDLAWQGQDPNAFDHPHVTFKLSGYHDSLACADCHRAKRKGPFALSDFPAQQRTTTYLGLGQDCMGCHEDIHAGGRAQSCDTCHDQNAFEPASYFQHDDYFTLEGVHAQASCSACHLLNAQESSENVVRTDPNRVHLAFKQAKGKTCSQCHASPHRATWDQDCQVCHVAADLTWLQGQRGIDLQIHSKLGFALEGAHTSLSCASCHPSDRSYAERYPDPGSPGYLRQPGHCQGCHQNPHGDQFTECYAGCRDCHTQAHFKPSTVDAAWHAKRFPLTEPHANLACAKCHLVDAQTGTQRFADTPSICQVCHQDPHQGQFQDRYESCLDCHDPNHFTPSTFTVNRHARFYALTGPHVQLTCDQCHPDETGLTLRRFAGTPHDCLDCHQSPHGGQFQDRGISCLKCHHSDRFMPTTFGPAQHSETYPLLGSHRAVACIQCHLIDAKTKVRQFKSTTKTCKICHPDPHGGQFQKELQQGDCTVCHLSDCTTFQLRPYDHEEKTGFSLTGAHAQAPCQHCHIERAVSQITGPEVRWYRPTPTECAACHQDVHRGQFQQDGQTRCERCHGSTRLWTAQKFVHERDALFPLEGAHAKISCRACHPVVPQKNGQPVIQYRPLNTRCEDCHGFISK